MLPARPPGTTHTHTHGNLSTASCYIVLCVCVCVQALESKLDGQLDVIQCDFFNLDPRTVITQKTVVRKSDKLFSDLGISEAKWTDGEMHALSCTLMHSHALSNTFFWNG